MPASFEADAEGVINLAFSIKINQKKMKKLEKEYTTMKTKEKEEKIELRVCFYFLFLCCSTYVAQVIVGISYKEPHAYRYS